MSIQDSESTESRSSFRSSYAESSPQNFPLGLKQQFGQRLNGQVRSHPDFGREFLRVRHVATEGDGEFESVAAEVRSKLVIRIVPPSTIGEIRTWQQRALDSLVQAEKWKDEDKRIGAEFTPYGMSYESYVIRTDSSDARFVFDAVRRQYGEVRLSVGQGVADGAYGHYALNKHLQGPITQTSIGEVFPTLSCPPEYVPWIDVGPLGEGAHKNTERVYEDSLVRLMEFYRVLFQQHLPDYLASIG